MLQLSLIAICDGMSAAVSVDWLDHACSCGPRGHTCDVACSALLNLVLHRSCYPVIVGDASIASKFTSISNDHVLCRQHTSKTTNVFEMCSSKMQHMSCKQQMKLPLWLVM